MLEVLALSIALSMDAFAVSLSLGTRTAARTAPFTLSWQAAVYFGLFQALMPLIGYWGGRELLGFLGHWTDWVACALLLGIGGKMILDALGSGGPDIGAGRVSQRLLLGLALATSIDALAAGFALNLLPVGVWLACALIGLTTAVMSVAGVWLGRRGGEKLQRHAEWLGGVILMVIGVRMVIF